MNDIVNIDTELKRYEEESIDRYDDAVLTPESRQYLERIILSAKKGLNSISPIICKGINSCPFISRCPIRLGGGTWYPIDRQCVMEMNFVKSKFDEYLVEYKDKGYSVETSPTLRNLLSQITDLDLMDLRLSYILAGVGGVSDGSLLIDQITNITEDHEEIHELSAHPAWAMKIEIMKMREKLLTAIIGTPKLQVWEDVSRKRVNNETVLTQNLALMNLLQQLEKKNE